MSWDEKQLHWHLTTRRFGRQTCFFDVIDSTNRWLMQNPAAFTLSGGVVAAGHQINGRGRNSREWTDTPGSALLCSTLMKLRNGQANKGFLSLLPAVALARVIKRHDSELEVSLKWPNDVLLAHKKVAGILAEATTYDGSDVVIVGVGVNVSGLPQRYFAWPATTLHAQSNWRPSREVLLAELLNEWEPLFDLFQDGDFDQLREAWEEFGPPRGAKVRRVEAQHTMEGEFQGLGNSGQLILKDAEGILRDVYSGDIAPA